MDTTPGGRTRMMMTCCHLAKRLALPAKISVLNRGRYCIELIGSQK